VFISISIAHPYDGSIYEVEVDPAVTPERCVGELIRVGFVKDLGSGDGSYVLCRENGRTLARQRSLYDSGVRGGDSLVLMAVAHLDY